MPGFYVAPGKSVTYKKGILSSGERALSKYFPGGAERLKELKDKGSLVEVK